MTWLKLDDKIRSHPKILKAGPEACWLWVCCLSYASDHLTDGVVPAEALPTLGPFRHVERLAAKLVEVGLLDRADGGYQVHDYLAWNPSAAEVRAKRSADSAQKAAAGRLGGLRSAEARREQRASEELEATVKQAATVCADVPATDGEADTEADTEQTSSTLPKHNSSPVLLPSGSRPSSSLRSDDDARPPRANGPDPEAAIAAWPAEWEPIRQSLAALPFLARHRAWLADLSWWQTMDHFVTSAPKELDALLLDAVAQAESEGYVPRTKKALRQKLRNLLHVAATIAEREARRAAQNPPR